MKKILLLFLLALAVMAYAGGAKWSNQDYSASLSVVTTGDTARVTMLANPIAVNSFAYIDTFSYQADTSAHATITWTSPSSATTVAMVVDSMVAYINADAGLDSFLTASNSGDTGILVTSDDPGVLFYHASLNDADTGGAFVEVTANATSWSGTTDTIWIDKFVERNHSFNSLMCRFIIEPSYITTQGIGGADSGYLWLYSGIDFNYTLLAVDTQASLPCTLYYSKPAAAGTDTLFKEDLFLVYRVADSASDTTATIPYNISSYYMLKEQ